MFCRPDVKLYIVLSTTCSSHLNLAVAMSFEYHIRFLFIQSLVTSPKSMRRYERVKVSRGEATRALLDTIGLRYNGTRNFELVDRTCTHIEDAIIPVYDVRLSLSLGFTIEELLRFYARLRDEDIENKW